MISLWLLGSLQSHHFYSVSSTPVFYLSCVNLPVWIRNPVKCFLSARSSPLTLWSSCSSLVRDRFHSYYFGSKSTSKGLNVNVKLLFLVIIVGSTSRRSCLPLSIVAIVGSASSFSKVAFTSSWISAAAFGGLPGHRGPLSTLSSSACPPLLLPHPAYFSSSSRRFPSVSTPPLFLLPPGSAEQ